MWVLKAYAKQQSITVHRFGEIEHRSPKKWRSPKDDGEAIIFLKPIQGTFGDGEPIFSEGPWGGVGPLLGVAQDHIDPRIALAKVNKQRSHFSACVRRRRVTFFSSGGNGGHFFCHHRGISTLGEVKKGMKEPLLPQGRVDPPFFT